MIENLWENNDVVQAFKPPVKFYEELITMWKTQLFNLNFSFSEDGSRVLV